MVRFDSAGLDTADKAHTHSPVDGNGLDDLLVGSWWENGFNGAVTLLYFRDASKTIPTIGSTGPVTVTSSQTTLSVNEPRKASSESTSSDTTVIPVVVTLVVLAVCSVGAAAAFVLVRRHPRAADSSLSSGNVPLEDVEPGNDHLAIDILTQGSRQLLSDIEVNREEESIPGGGSHIEDQHVGMWHGTKITVRVISLEGADQDVIKAGAESLVEIAVLERVNHPCVVRFLGLARGSDGARVVPSDDPAWRQNRMFVCSEWCDGGSLAAALTRQAIPTTPADLESYVLQASSALSFLESQGITHNNLSAAAFQVKSSQGEGSRPSVLLSGFGGFGTYARVESIMFRWSCPEKLQPGKRVAASDVFSFASTAVEILDCGIAPYSWLESNEAVMEAIKVGEHPRQPEACSGALFAVLTPCWVMNPQDRPTFAELAASIEHTVSSEAAPSDSLTATPLAQWTGDEVSDDYQG
jgi:Protein tyrosine and serine/threonine kinase